MDTADGGYEEDGYGYDAYTPDERSSQDAQVGVSSYEYDVDQEPDQLTSSGNIASYTVEEAEGDAPESLEATRSFYAPDSTYSFIDPLSAEQESDGYIDDEMEFSTSSSLSDESTLSYVPAPPSTPVDSPPSGRRQRGLVRSEPKGGDHPRQFGKEIPRLVRSGPLTRTGLSLLLDAERNAREDWNELFQRAQNMTEGPNRWKALSTLGRDFVYASKTYGKIIISEFSLPYAKKTIQPTDCGGRAGGMKYIVSGIFFKFALDMKDENGKWMYGEGNDPYDDGAMKAASNDMLGLLAYYNSNVPGLHYPLFCIVDYRGFRLLAMSILPIRKETTLCYGSQDGARNVTNSNRELSDKMKAVGNALGLKEHRVQAQASTLNGKRVAGQIVSICAPVDIEGHLGTDGKYYVLDFGRVFPPEAPTRPSREIFYKLLRPEYIRQYSTPLSSDAYSGFGYLDRAVHNPEVLRATQHLYKNCIPAFVRDLESASANRIDRLTERIHRGGINCRHLGIIYSLIDPTRTELRQSILSEIVCRTLKSMLRTMMRTHTKQLVGYVAKHEPYRKLSFKLLRAVLSPCQNDMDSYKAAPTPLSIDKVAVKDLKQPSFWCYDLKHIIVEKFRKTFSDEELASLQDIRSLVDMECTILRFCELSGIRLRKDLMQEYLAHPQTFRLMPFDLKKIHARIRHLNVIDEAEGSLLFREALTQPNAASGIWPVIHDKFEHAVSSNTNNANAFLKWGKVLLAQSEVVSRAIPDNVLPQDYPAKFESIFSLLDRASEKFRMAKEINGSHWEIIYHDGLINVERGVLQHIVGVRTETARMASSQWHIQLAVESFENSFRLHPEAFTDICEQSERWFREAQGTFSHFQCQLFLLRAFYILHAGMKASLVPLNANLFFRAAYYLIYYLKRGGADPGHHMAGAAGSMLESALILCPSLAGDETVLRLDQTTQFLPGITAQQYGISRTVHRYSIGPNEQCRWENSITLQPKETILHFTPFTVENPQQRYVESIFLGQLLHVLGQYETSSYPVPFDLRQTSFILYNSVSNKFLLTSFSVGIGLEGESVPQSISLIASDLPTHDRSLEAFEADPGAQVICTVYPKAGANQFTVTHTLPARYLIVLITTLEGSSVYSLSHLTFYGVLIDSNNETAAQSPSQKAEKIYPPRPVRWIEPTCDLATVSHLTVHVKKKQRRRFISKALKHGPSTCLVRGSPALTFLWDPQSHRISQRKTRAVLVIVDTQKELLLHREMVQQAKSRGTKSVTHKTGRGRTRELHVESLESKEDLFRWLSARDFVRGELSSSLHAGTFRIAFVSHGKEDGEDYVDAIQALTAHPLWKEIPTILYSLESSPVSISDNLHLVWSTNNSRVAMDFMSMQVCSGVFNFDPHEKYSATKSHKLTSSPTPLKLSSSSIRVKETLFSPRRLAHSGKICSKPPTLAGTVERSVSMDSHEEIYRRRQGPFLYFEIKFVAEEDCSDCLLSVGLTPKQYPDNAIGVYPGSYGLSHNGSLYCGSSTPVRFKDLVNSSFTPNDIIGCGYNQQMQEVYWTKNGVYLGTAELSSSQVPSISQPLFPSVATKNFAGRIEGNFGSQAFLFDPTSLQKIVEHSFNVPKEIELQHLCPFHPRILTSAELKQYLPILSTVAWFSASMQLLLRAMMIEITSVSSIIDLSEHHLKQPIYGHTLGMITDSVLAGIGEILPRNCFAMNLSQCNKLSELFFPKIQHIDRMRMINLSGVDSLSDQSARCLVEECKLLEYVRVWENISDDALQEIAKLPKLRTLDLSNCNKISSAGVHSVLKRVSLRGLILDDCPTLDDKAFLPLAKTKYQTLSQLERLSLYRGRFTESTLIILLQNLPRLLSLHLGRWAQNQFQYTDNVIDTICSTTLCTQLRGLSLYRTAITDQGFMKLTRHCEHLEELNIGQTELSNEALVTMSKCPVTRVEFPATITDISIYVILERTEIEEISLHRCHSLTSTGIANVLPLLQKCVFLCLKQTAADIRVIEYLYDMQCMPDLQYLDIRKTHIPMTPKSLEMLQQRRPGLTIYTQDSPRPIADGRFRLMWTLPNSRIINMHRRTRSF